MSSISRPTLLLQSNRFTGIIRDANLATVKLGRSASIKLGRNREANTGQNREESGGETQLEMQ